MVLAWQCWRGNDEFHPFEVRAFWKKPKESSGSVSVSIAFQGWQSTGMPQSESSGHPWVIPFGGRTRHWKRWWWMALCPNGHRPGRDVLVYSDRSENLVAALSLWKFGSRILLGLNEWLLRSPREERLEII